jgi:pyruvate, orthophosphate dikinase
MKSNIHFFSQKESVKKVETEKLGIRGRQANEFAQLQFPILPGFIIDSDAASALAKEDVGKETAPYVKKIEDIVGKSFGNPKNPLLLKVVVSPNLAISNYPTLHNFGLAENIAEGFASFVGENFAAHEVLFLVRGMLKIEERIAELTADEGAKKKIKEGADKVIAEIKSEKSKKTALDYIADFKPYLPEGFFKSAQDQLVIALKRISLMLDKDEQNDGDTAILVQPMVYGNYGKDSASGSFYTRNVVSGEKKLQGEFFQDKFNEIGGSGKDINKIDPAYLKDLQKIAWKLEDYLKEIRQIRFTIENKKVWLIEQRAVDAKSTQADIQILLDLAKRKIVDDSHVVMSIKPGMLNEILHPIIDIGSVKGLKAIKGGIAGAPGAAIGRVYFTTESLLDAYKVAQQQGEDKRCILVMPATFAEDVKAIEVATGVLSCEGGYSAHASVVARQYGKVSLVKTDMKIRGKKAIFGDVTVNEGDYITMNIPYYGEPAVYIGKASLIEPDPRGSGLLDFISVVEGFVKDFHVRTNADSPRDAELALSFGAQGIGLCRTEHMFFNEKRINAFREMIVSDNKEDRVKALSKLKAMQREDFYGIFKVMAGKEVTIRLLDAPLHEFLPHNEAEMAAFLKYLSTSKKGAKVSKSEIAALCDAISEFNPMLGHRGASRSPIPRSTRCRCGPSSRRCTSCRRRRSRFTPRS